MDSNIAIDLSVRSSSMSQPINLFNSNNNEDHQVPIVRPIPRLPWTITWYRSMWAVNHNHVSNSGQTKVNPYLPDNESCNKNSENNSATSKTAECSTAKNYNLSIDRQFSVDNDNFQETRQEVGISPGKSRIQIEQDLEDSEGTLSTILDIACCDGPVVFERVSNPNFALTVEHSESTCENNGGGTKVSDRRHLALKTYLCIYCNQNFKSLFCYQKHKKRHLNPVSVDITATHDTTIPKHNNIPTENKQAKTKDLNVQFFPCKKCGCKFPSYYFVHKHRKVCHPLEDFDAL